MSPRSNKTPKSRPALAGRSVGRDRNSALQSSQTSVVPEWRWPNPGGTKGGSKMARREARPWHRSPGQRSIARTSPGSTTIPRPATLSGRHRSPRRGNGATTRRSPGNRRPDEVLHSSWRQLNRSGDAGRNLAEPDGSTVAPAPDKISRMSTERIARLAGRDHEQALVQVGQIIDAAIGRAVHRL